MDIYSLLFAFVSPVPPSKRSQLKWETKLKRNFNFLFAAAVHRYRDI